MLNFHALPVPRFWRELRLLNPGKEDVTVTNKRTNAWNPVLTGGAYIPVLQDPVVTSWERFPERFLCVS